MPILAAGFLSLAVSIGIGRFVYTPILPAMVSGLGLTKASAGLIGSANFAGYLAGALIALRPLSPERRPAWLFGALGLCVVTLFAMGVASTLTAFILLRFVCGIASALGFILATAIVLDRLTAVERRDLAPLHYAGVGAGIAFAALAVSFSENAGLGWRSLWEASGVLALALTAPILWLTRRVPVADRTAAISDRADRVAPSIAPLMTAYGLFGFGYVVTATFLITIVRDSPALQSSEAYVWLVVGIAAAPSITLWAFVERKLGFRWTFASACLIEASGVLASVLDVGALGIFYAAIALGATFVALTSLGLDGARKLRVSNPQQTMAIMMAAFGIGQVVGPIAAGLMADLTGSFKLSSATAAVALIASAALVISTRRRGP